jgi:hypothetical protein
VRLAARRAARELSKALDDPSSTDWVATAKRCLLLLAMPKRRVRVKDPARAARRTTVKELDAMCRAVVFARDEGKCRKCGKSDGLLDWAHVLSRRHPKVRHDPENSMVLCRAHHMWWHDRPVEAAAWFKKEFDGVYERLIQRNGGPGRANNGLTRLHLIQESRKYGLKLGGV